MDALNFLNRDRIRRWAIIRDYSNDDSVLAEIVNISNSPVTLENYLCVEISEEDDLTTLFHSVSNGIRNCWFAVGKEDYYENFETYNSLDILSDVTARARHKIWIDVPRTFDIFCRKSGRYEDILNDPARKSRILAILCRVLCSSAKILGGWYCQGMSFVAASYILYFYSAFNWTLSEASEEDIYVQDILIGTYVLGVYHCCVLKECGFEYLYAHGPTLEVYLSEFGHQLRATEQTAPVFAHLESLHFTTHFYAVEWFTTCFVLTLDTDVCIMIQDMLIYGKFSKKNILIKIGVAIMAALSQQLLSFDAMEQVQMHLKGMTMQLTCADVIPFAMTYKVKPPVPPAAAATRTQSQMSGNRGGASGAQHKSSGGFLAALLDKRNAMFSSASPPSDHPKYDSGSPTHDHASIGERRVNKEVKTWGKSYAQRSQSVKESASSTAEIELLLYLSQLK